jgi:glycosyltransferase involved in cell wall biosynthesis
MGKMMQKNNELKHFEIVVPVYNEERQLKQSIMILYDFLNEKYPSSQWRVTIANNGSRDCTKEIALELTKKYENIKYFNLDEKGFGKAVKSVWRGSSYSILGFIDLDLATDLKHLPEAIDTFQDRDVDIVVGSRLLPESVVENRTLLREITSRVFNFILKKYLRVNYSDGMCGFKFIKKESYAKLSEFGVQNDGWFFSTELLIIADFLNLKMYELPIHWVDNEDSKVQLIDLVKKYLIEMRRVKSRLRNGKKQLFRFKT